MEVSSLNIENINSDSKTNEFEDIYLQVRKAEQRIYTDEEVKKLPLISKDHVHYPEWEIRRKSFQKLVKFLDKKGRPLEILEIGCGNGWLSANLAKHNTQWEIVGTDINNTELEQAKRVFDSLDRLDFLYFDLNSNEWGYKKFDIIIFAASIQYFQSIKQTIDNALVLLKPGGEIHIIDSIFYQANEIESARKRTLDYYNSIGFPRAAEHYFHHTVNELENYNMVFFQKPSFINKLFGSSNPFHWVSISRSQGEQSK